MKENFSSYKIESLRRSADVCGKVTLLSNLQLSCMSGSWKLFDAQWREVWSKCEKKFFQLLLGTMISPNINILQRFDQMAIGNELLLATWFPWFHLLIWGAKETKSSFLTYLCLRLQNLQKRKTSGTFDRVLTLDLVILHEDKLPYRELRWRGNSASLLLAERTIYANTSTLEAALRFFLARA